MATNWVYIASNASGSVLYHGSTSAPRRRWEEHVSGTGSKFFKRYGLDRIVWFEAYPDVQSALTVEHRLKRKSRKRKWSMIIAFNPEWADMSAEWFAEEEATFD